MTEDEYQATLKRVDFLMRIPEKDMTPAELAELLSLADQCEAHEFGELTTWLGDENEVAP